MALSQPFQPSPATLASYAPNPRARIGGNGPPRDRLRQLRLELAIDLVGFEFDPLGFVLWAFPWGKPGTALEFEDGPEEWQREQLDEIGYRLRRGDKAGAFEKVREARVSGHGIGKSAEVSWLILWALMTKENTRGVVTANTDTQLRTKTWAELAKWYHLLVNPLLRQDFKLEGQSIHRTKKSQERTWRIDAVPNSERNPAAFAGLHNAGIRSLMLFDEASEIPDIIWDTAEGATTDRGTQIVWCVYGNPTKNQGRFKEVVEGRFRHMWQSEHIDARNVSRGDQELFAQWAAAWGEDSDFMRTRVKGQFPRQGTMQLIPSDIVTAARARIAEYEATAALVAGLDVAAYGDDQSVLAVRKGYDAKEIPWQRWRGMDPMALAAQVAMWCFKWKPDALFVDVGGVGLGVYSRLLQLNVPNVYPTEFGSKGWNVDFNGVEVKSANCRAAIWTAMREWLKYGALPDEAEIETDLTGVQYGFNGEQAVLLEPKEAMKRRGLASPDNGDALACTFTFPVLPKVQRHEREVEDALQRLRTGVDDQGVGYDIHRDLR